MVSMQTHLRRYNLRPDPARLVPPVPRRDVASPWEQDIQVAVSALAWIVVPGVFWGALALWLAGP
jgi:hypothetical protein